MFSNVIVFVVGVSEHDKEGRVITAEYEKFFLVTSCEILTYCFDMI